MREFIDCLAERNFRARKVGFIENGTWSPISAKLMRERLACCKDLDYIEKTVKIRAAFSAENAAELEALANGLI